MHSNLQRPSVGLGHRRRQHADSSPPIALALNKSYSFALFCRSCFACWEHTFAAAAVVAVALLEVVSLKQKVERFMIRNSRKRAKMLETYFYQY